MKHQLIKGDKVLLVKNKESGQYHFVKNQYPNSGCRYKKYISFSIGECDVIGSWNIK